MIYLVMCILEVSCSIINSPSKSWTNGKEACFTAMDQKL